MAVMAVYDKKAWTVAKVTVDGEHLKFDGAVTATWTVYSSSTELEVGNDDYGHIIFNVIDQPIIIGKEVTFVARFLRDNTIMDHKVVISDARPIIFLK
jgi:hypothetical protein